jgi:hypothetical protein
MPAGGGKADGGAGASLREIGGCGAGASRRQIDGGTQQPGRQAKEKRVLFLYTRLTELGLLGQGLYTAFFWCGAKFDSGMNHTCHVSDTGMKSCEPLDTRK